MSRSRSSEESEDEDQQRYRKENSDPEDDAEEEKSSRKRSSRKSHRSKRESPPKRVKRRTKYDYSRSRSRSVSGGPAADNKHKETGNRDAPEPSHCLGVFGLSSQTDEKDLMSVFKEYGEVEKIYLVKDRDFGTSKGFGFVYFKTIEDAEEARNKTQGLELDRREIRVDFSLTSKPHPPTPGHYLGKSSHRSGRRFDNYDHGYGRRRFQNYRENYNERSFDRGFRHRDSNRMNYERRDYGRREYERRPSYRSSFDDEYYDDYEEERYSRRPNRYSVYQNSRHY